LHRTQGQVKTRMKADFLNKNGLKTLFSAISALACTCLPPHFEGFLGVRVQFFETVRQVEIYHKSNILLAEDFVYGCGDAACQATFRACSRQNDHRAGKQGLGSLNAGITVVSKVDLDRAIPIRSEEIVVADEFQYSILIEEPGLQFELP